MNCGRRYTWWHNGAHLDLNEEFIRPLTDGDIELTLRSVFTEGVYQCEASNQYGTTCWIIPGPTQTTAASRSQLYTPIDTTLLYCQCFTVFRHSNWGQKEELLGFRKCSSFTKVILGLLHIDCSWKTAGNSLQWTLILLQFIVNCSLQTFHQVKSP